MRCKMNIQYQVPWSELLWQGLAEDTGEFIRGQLFRIGKDYYICRSHMQGYYQYSDSIYPTLMIGEWYKIAPFTLERVEFVEVSEEEEQEYIKNFKSEVSQEEVEVLRTYEKKYRELVEDFKNNWH